MTVLEEGGAAVRSPACTPAVLRAGALLAGLAAAVAARRASDPWPGATSLTAAAVFVLLVAVVVALDVWAVPRGAVAGGRADGVASGGARRVAVHLGVGLFAALALCAGPWLEHVRDPGGALPLAEFGPWALAVTAVAVAQEAIIRGRIWDAVAAASRRTGTPAQVVALLVTTGVFAVVHVPFYGLAVLGVDVAAGLVLGGLRLLTGGLLAPVTAHVAADLAGWWMP